MQYSNSKHIMYSMYGPYGPLHYGGNVFVSSFNIKESDLLRLVSVQIRQNLNAFETT